jgi:hypothetical protein
MKPLFSGSYLPDDVAFLVTLLPPQPPIEVAEKEALIQSGARHYSEMLSPETVPSTAYQAIFNQACTDNGTRMAQDCLNLAALIAQRQAGEITLVSLLRGGTPVGVILTRLLRACWGRQVRHYSVSIVRDRGLDTVALHYILAQGAAPESIVFLDGWTGKGVIARELKTTIDTFNRKHNTAINSGLYTLVDLAGASAGAASSLDYLIPCSILNATVSGLISRSVLSPTLGPQDFHGCVYYTHLAPADVSLWFVDEITATALALYKQNGWREPAEQNNTPPENTPTEDAAHFLHRTQTEYAIADINLIKPGLGEATRVLLRRAPRLLLLRDANAPEVAHLRHLAAEKCVPIKEDPRLPYQAVSLIRSSTDG